ncbi:Gfo/Idh/MocA family oxidoreductase [Eisenbergiella sp.]
MASPGLMVPSSYEELVRDENVDLLYIATPHSEHFENAKLCIAHGRQVLCEKLFTANAHRRAGFLKWRKRPVYSLLRPYG